MFRRLIFCVFVCFLATAATSAAPEWRQMYSGTTTQLWDVWGSSPSDVFVVGDNSTILHYDGTSWSPMDNPTTKSLNSLACGALQAQMCTVLGVPTGV